MSGGAYERLEGRTACAHIGYPRSLRYLVTFLLGLAVAFEAAVCISVLIYKVDSRLFFSLVVVIPLTMAAAFLSDRAEAEEARLQAETVA